MKRMLLGTAVAMALVAIMVPTVASADVDAVSINSTGARFSAGDIIQVGINATCDSGEILLIRATVTQGDAFGEATGGVFCTGSSQSIPATLRTFGGAFDDANATVCVVAATIDRFIRVIEAEQHCAVVDLT